ncbi:hypothetical protein GQ44DRAFT_624042, partial [Phaeosphaeriaceae sp. PMI808]
DTSCLCDKKAQRLAASDCVFTSCTVREAFTTLNVTAVACEEPVRDKSRLYHNVNVTFFTLSIVAIIGQFAAHIAAGRRQPLNDGNMVVIMVCVPVQPRAQSLIYIAFTGLGQDMWKVPFESITTTLLYFWISEIGYFVVIGFIKIAFLLFYLQIFPKRGFRKVVWGFIGFMIASTVAFVLAAVFVCSPVNYAWMRWDGEHKGKCINNNSLAFSHAVISILTDFAALSLPITQIWTLHLALKKKIGVLLMFSVGSFVTVVSIVRLRALVHFAKTTNVTWDYLETSLWSLIEIYVGIICACMPALNLGLQRIFPKILGSSHQSISKPTGTGQSEGNRLNPDTIAVQTSFKVSRSMKPQTNDVRSFVQLVEIDGDARSTQTGAET